MSSLFGPDAIKFRINHGEAKAVVCSGENAPKVREAVAGGDRAVKIIVTGGAAEAGELSYEDALAAASADFQPIETHHEDPAFLIYTSGTTGDPKGALHAHRIAFGQIPAFQAVYEFYPEAADVFGRLGYPRVTVVWWYLCHGKLIERGRQDLAAFAAFGPIGLVDPEADVYHLVAFGRGAGLRVGGEVADQLDVIENHNQMRSKLLFLLPSGGFGEFPSTPII